MSGRLLQDHLRLDVYFGDLVSHGCLCRDQPGRLYLVEDRMTAVEHAAHLEEVLAAHDAEVKAAAWEEGYSTGYSDCLFDERGLSTDPDAHEFPHENPYRADALDRPEAHDGAGRAGEGQA